MATTPIPQKILARQHEITADFMRLVDEHIADVVAGRATEMLEIRDLAGQLCIHPTHLSNTLKLTTGHPPCHYFEAQLLATAQQLLRDTDRPIAAIAANLTYDPSNFTKFFKRFAGCTPKQYREQVGAQRRAEIPEVVTI
ncbi:helix-turn-helix transcriptional regulator [Hymenobacter coccineus]|uniref:DNA-binding protein n=1 Tax=Hymenobacter coccineus TaxID=1908235 RepID=A0A1G1TN36_9BACT|nr:helix-turn-helix transcriptional regulator [Hymenobacter coccineus]OGX92271.1 DNA-binding protein [Hymenobacter coccineus]